MVISWVNVRDCNAWVGLLASVVQQRKQAARPGWHNWVVVVISPELAVFLYRHGLGPLGPTHVLLLLLRQYEQLFTSPVQLGRKVAKTAWLQGYDPSWEC